VSAGEDTCVGSAMGNSPCVAGKPGACSPFAHDPGGVDRAGCGARARATPADDDPGGGSDPASGSDPDSGGKSSASCLPALGRGGTDGVQVPPVPRR
jgi:hypothetical protein